MASQAVSSFNRQQAQITARLNQFRKSGAPIAKGIVGATPYIFQRSTRFACRLSGGVLLVTIPAGAF